MHFYDNNFFRGHLQITKRDVVTKAEEVVFDDHNIIVSGMGAAITNALIIPDCLPPPQTCAEDIDNVGNFPPAPASCKVEPYLLKLFQLGINGSEEREVKSTHTLGDPLTEEEYGGSGTSLLSYQTLRVGTNGSALGEQTFVDVTNQVAIGDFNLLTYIILDETACNGLTLNEIGLFSQDPFLVGFGEMGDERVPHMAAYRNFTGIPKDSGFELIIRWNIFFDTDCSLV